MPPRCANAASAIGATESAITTFLDGPVGEARGARRVVEPWTAVAELVRDLAERTIGPAIELREQRTRRAASRAGCAAARTSPRQTSTT